MLDQSTSFRTNVAMAVLIAASVGVGTATVEAIETNARQDAQLEAVDDLNRRLEVLTRKYEDVLRELERLKGRIDQGK